MEKQGRGHASHLWKLSQLVVVVVGGGGGSDTVHDDMCLSMCHRMRATNWWRNTWESDSRRPRHLGLNVQEDGRRKMPQSCGENDPPQTMNILSMSWSEAPPGTAGNLSLQHTATSTTMQRLQLRHHHSFLHSMTLRTCRAQQRARQQPPRTVLLVHTDQDTEHLGPDDNRRRYSAKKNRHQRNPAWNMPLPVSTTSASQHN